ncbi:MAG: hypothetical protein P1V36_01660 [Planctomycetota bacterium]|nr:hypothetical protein [Planctomycetota bacterium]
MPIKVTAHDRAHAKREYESNMNEWGGDEDAWPHLAMFSFGYADIHDDGDVVAYGGIAFNIDDEVDDEVVHHVGIVIKGDVDASSILDFFQEMAVAVAGDLDLPDDAIDPDEIIVRTFVPGRAVPPLFPDRKE